MKKEDKKRPLMKKEYQINKKRRDVLERGTIRFSDLIAPDAIENDINVIKVGDRYMRTIVATAYPRTSHMGWLNPLYSYGANIDISSHIEPLPTDKVIKLLNRKIGQYISTERMDLKKRGVTDVETEIARNDAEKLRDDLAKGKEKLFYQTLYINIAGKTMEELDTITEEIESLCGELGMLTRHAMFQQEQGFRSVLPIAEDRLRFRRNFPTSSLATCLPFVSAELTRQQGDPILYGLNMINGSLVMFDRFSLPNYNSVTLASSGAGKSYFVKLEAIRLMSMGANVIVIDPQGEYKRIAEALGGQHIKLSSSSKHRINPLEIEKVQEEENGQNFLTQKILDVYAIIEVMIGNRELSARERKITLDALENTYRKFGITRDIKSIESDNFIEGETFTLEGSKKRMPTLSDLDQSLRQLGEDGIQIADELQPYVSGFLDLFNGETNVDTSSNFIVFDIKDTEKELSDIAMFTSLEFIWNKIKKGDNKKRLLVVDEAWMLMKNKQSSEYLVRIAKTARKFKCGLSILSQQSKDFLQNGGEGIVGNTAMQVLLNHQANDIKPVAEMFGLSQSEQNFIRTARPGEALIYAAGTRTAVQVTSHRFEHILCETNPAEIEKIKDLLK